MSIRVTCKRERESIYGPWWCLQIWFGIWLNLCYFCTQHVGLDRDVKPKHDGWASEWLVNKRKSRCMGLDYVCNCLWQSINQSFLASMCHVLFSSWFNLCYFRYQHVGLGKDVKAKPDDWAWEWLVNKRESHYMGLDGVCTLLASLCLVSVRHLIKCVLFPLLTCRLG